MAVPSIAAGSYAAAQKLIDTSGGGASASGFGDLVKQSLASFDGQAKAVDHQVASTVAGRADYVSVATSVAESETAIETLVAVRDKVLAAYEEIMRMTV